MATPSSPSLIDTFLGIFSKEKRRANEALAAAAKSSTGSSAAFVGTEGELVSTPYGPGQLQSKPTANGIVRIQLAYAVAFMHVSVVTPLQLLRAPAPIHFATLNPSTGRFEKQFGFYTAVVDPSAPGVVPVNSFATEHIRVKTPYGTGELVGAGRRDGIVQVRLPDHTTHVFTTFEQVEFIVDEDAQQKQAQADAVAEEEAEEEEEADAAAPADGKKKGKKGKKGGK